MPDTSEPGGIPEHAQEPISVPESELLNLFDTSEKIRGLVTSLVSSGSPNFQDLGRLASRDNFTLNGFNPHHDKNKATIDWIKQGGLEDIRIGGENLGEILRGAGLPNIKIEDQALDGISLHFAKNGWMGDRDDSYVRGFYNLDFQAKPKNASSDPLFYSFKFSRDGKFVKEVGDYVQGITPISKAYDPSPQDIELIGIGLNIITSYVNHVSQTTQPNS